MAITQSLTIKLTGSTAAEYAEVLKAVAAAKSGDTSHQIKSAIEDKAGRSVTVVLNDQPYPKAGL